MVSNYENNFNCVVCMNQKSFNTLMMNTRCGHACICDDCESRLPFTVFTEKNCPLCRRSGEYRRVLINTDTDTDTETDDYHETHDNENNNQNNNNQNNNQYENENTDIVIDVEQNNDPRVIKLKQILYEGISPNYFIITCGKLNSFNPQDDRLENMVMAFYGTEQSSYHNNKPFFIDVTRRIQLAINVRRTWLVVNDENLLKSHTINTKNWVLTMLCMR